ncbi:DUF2911 domain-containing protein [Tenacibaculum sp. nBUS_03]|uniref:DUF2911 domain-containing protein n=1 Tax=Tenacibaculum sp. nBUS_03 TaxID=3395320 RepID=UPI003EBAE72E
MKTLYKLIFPIILITFNYNSFAQDALMNLKLPKKSQKGKIEQTIGYSDFEIKYSRPSMKNRKIFGKLVPFNTRWRTGADERTTLKVNTPFIINKDTIPAGKYAIFTVPKKDQWEFILYSDHEGWGWFRNWDESKVVSRTTHKSKSLHDTVETFTINFSDLKNNLAGNLNLVWENTLVTIPIKVPTEKIANNKITKFMSPHEVNYRGIAVYYLSNNVELDKVIEISDKIYEINKGTSTAFWSFHFKAVAYNKMNNNQKRDIEIKNGMDFIDTLKDVSQEARDWYKAVIQKNEMI